MSGEEFILRGRRCFGLWERINFDLCWVGSKRFFCEILQREGLILGQAITATFYCGRRIDYLLLRGN